MRLTVLSKHKTKQQPPANTEEYRKEQHSQSHTPNHTHSCSGNSSKIVTKQKRKKSVTRVEQPSAWEIQQQITNNNRKK